MAEHDDDWILFRLQRLDPFRFEELCFALLKAKGHQDVRHLGAAGGERGIDVLSVVPDGKRWVTQCKRCRSLSPSDVRPRSSQSASRRKSASVSDSGRTSFTSAEESK